jgi:hypothetical protein
VSDTSMIKKIYLAQIMSIFEKKLVILLMITGFYLLLIASLNYWPKYFRTIFAVVIFGYWSYRSVNLFHQYKNKEDKQ